ncbi:hypothetical protein TBLA_0B01450 [Henningerozyma blattae CBS 6284]|uniref:Uncharacterized protein n=1 Tax=Henningerozyma blattae (strain ATCC 34711 / CBS 6284 / DSM 70876 / NBRC 10599 / NRRL Y-10934 / UCD 77-7) TaxID=1071380 RepID=I2GXY6_HENB6|nr:hypothetical protein TBLA_0B01450 [Tetrapisispora blattae CBS 6284]CCH58988.1 hypothetical protein TBLA_0B01450 [Tetrapisispora blattae CBS 6284]
MDRFTNSISNKFQKITKSKIRTRTQPYDELHIPSFILGCLITIIVLSIGPVLSMLWNGVFSSMITLLRYSILFGILSTIYWFVIGKQPLNSSFLTNYNNNNNNTSDIKNDAVIHSKKINPPTFDISKNNAIESRQVPPSLIPVHTPRDLNEAPQLNKRNKLKNIFRPNHRVPSPPPVEIKQTFQPSVFPSDSQNLDKNDFELINYFKSEPNKSNFRRPFPDETPLKTTPNATENTKNKANQTSVNSQSTRNSYENFVSMAPNKSVMP